jgi:cytoskeleton protein RodZ
MHYVRAIESDNYDKLPGKVFAKGYIKSYALLLQLDQDDIIGLYDEFAALTVEKAQEEVRLVDARKKKDQILPWLIFSVFAFVAGILCLWIFNQFFSSADTLDPAAEAQNTLIGSPQDAVVLAATGELVIDRERSQETIAQPAISSPDETPVISNSIASRQFMEDNNTGASRDGVVTDLGQALDGRLIEVINVGSDQLLISFTGICWIELMDAGSSKVYREIQKPGDQLRITGTAPFSILLGDATFVTMQINGIEVDVEESIRIDNSARLIVGR